MGDALRLPAGAAGINSKVVCLALGGNGCPISYTACDRKYFSITGRYTVSVLKDCKCRLRIYGYHGGDGTSIAMIVAGKTVYSNGPGGSSSYTHTETTEFKTGQQIQLVISGASYYDSYGFIELVVTK